MEGRRESTPDGRLELGPSKADGRRKAVGLASSEARRDMVDRGEGESGRQERGQDGTDGVDQIGRYICAPERVREAKGNEGERRECGRYIRRGSWAWSSEACSRSKRAIRESSWPVQLALHSYPPLIHHRLSRSQPQRRQRLPVHPGTASDSTVHPAWYHLYKYTYSLARRAFRSPLQPTYAVVGRFSSPVPVCPQVSNVGVGARHPHPTSTITRK